jgi:3-hydroxyacyl-CoA dehydrogenase
LPTTPATSTSPCAGASAGRRDPFESWQAAGWQAIAEAVKADVDAGQAMSPAALPGWVFGQVAEKGVHAPQGSYSASADSYCKPRSTLPVYQRQIFPERVLA